MKNYNKIQMAASKQMSNEIVTSNNTNRMMNDTTKSAGISHPAANMANLGKNIDKNSMEYLNEKVDTMIVGVPYPFRVCRWMMNIVVHCGTKAQKTSFAYLSGIGYNRENFKGYALRLGVAPEEEGILRKNIKHIINLMKAVRKSDEPYADAFIARMENLITGFTGLLKDVGELSEVVYCRG